MLVACLQCDVKLSIALQTLGSIFLIFMPRLFKESTNDDQVSVNLQQMFIFWILSILVILTKGLLVSHYTNLKKNLVSRMTEYFNLINRVGEGVLILSKDLIAGHY